MTHLIQKYKLRLAAIVISLIILSISAIFVLSNSINSRASADTVRVELQPEKPNLTIAEKTKVKVLIYSSRSAEGLSALQFAFKTENLEILDVSQLYAVESTNAFTSRIFKKGYNETRTQYIIAAGFLNPSQELPHIVAFDITIKAHALGTGSLEILTDGEIESYVSGVATLNYTLDLPEKTTVDINPPSVPLTVSINSTSVCLNTDPIEIQWNDPYATHLDIGTYETNRFSNKNIEGLTKTTIPDGLRPAVTLEPNKKYWLRTWNGVTYSQIYTFTTLDSCTNQITPTLLPSPSITPTPTIRTVTTQPTQCKQENIVCGSSSECCTGFSCNQTPKGKFCKKSSSNPPTGAVTIPPTSQCKQENIGCSATSECCTGFSCNQTPKGKLCKKSAGTTQPTATPVVNPPNAQCTAENQGCNSSTLCCSGLSCKLTSRGTYMCKK